MSIERHVPTRETCEKLKAAGFGQDTLFQYSYNGMSPAEFQWGLGLTVPGDEMNWCAAPLATEILAEYIMILHPIAFGASPTLWETRTGWGKGADVAEHTNPAEALALLWLAVKEGK